MVWRPQAHEVMSSCVPLLTVREGGTEPWLCRTSAFSLINRLGNWVVVTFFFCHCWAWCLQASKVLPIK
jgi:hypothetical protein